VFTFDDFLQKKWWILTKKMVAKIKHICYNISVDPVLNSIRELFYALLPFKGRSARSLSSRKRNWINQTVPLSL